MKRRTRRVGIRYILCGFLGIAILTAFVWIHFGGFGTGNSANVAEFAAYAQSVEKLSISDDKKIIALGEATHGNIEFQQLKLEVLKRLVEQYGVRAFALEGDYGGCEQVNQYIHGGKGTAQEAVKAIGFAIYQTDAMAELISYMREYNESALEGEDIRFYGFDMQRISYTFQSLMEACAALGVETAALQKLAEGESLSREYSFSTQIEMLTQVTRELKNKKASDQTLHCADVVLQHCKLQALTAADGGALRDQLMAANVEWILAQEQQRGHERIFVTGHNSHVAKWGSYDSMGKILSKKAQNGYYAIGTDFYRTCCNLPIRSSQKRTNQVFYSHNPLAKAAKLAGFDTCWLDFAKVPANSELAGQISAYTYMGKLGESDLGLMRIFPQSYRIFQPPAVLYDSMIFVSNASPTTIIQ